jgi:hypothetical protein
MKLLALAPVVAAIGAGVLVLGLAKTDPKYIESSVLLYAQSHEREDAQRFAQSQMGSIVDGWQLTAFGAALLALGFSASIQSRHAGSRSAVAQM